MPSETHTAQPIGPDWTETERWLIPEHWVEEVSDDPDDKGPPPGKTAARPSNGNKASRYSDAQWRRRTGETGRGVH
jgi:hypothetical protein